MIPVWILIWRAREKSYNYRVNEAGCRELHFFVLNDINFQVAVSYEFTQEGVHESAYRG